jgi:hypothetical protein
MMPNFYADTAEALEDVTVSASEALGAFVSFRVYNFLLKLTLKVNDYITVPIEYGKVPGVGTAPYHACCVGTGVQFSAFCFFL